MKLQHLALAVATLVATNLYAQTETYNVEAGLLGLTGSNDNNVKQNWTGISGTYYFKPIKIDVALPYAEMDFLNKASSVAGQIANASLETDVLASQTINPINFAGKLYVDKFILGLGTSSWDKKNFSLKSNSAQYVGIGSTGTSFEIGYFILPSTSISLLTSKSTATYSVSPGLNAVKDEVVSSSGIKSHSVVSLATGNFMAFDLFYNQIKTEQDKSQNNNEFGGSVRYYPKTSFYLEGGYKTNTGDNKYNTGNTTSIGLGYAFTPRFGFVLGTSRFNGDDSTQKSSGTNTTFTIGYRF